MKRIRGYVVSLLAAGTLVGAALPACTTNDQTLFITGALAPPSSRTNGGCTFTNERTQAQLFYGHYDVGLADSYYAVLMVGNQLTPRADLANNRAESNLVHITGGVVRVTDPDGAPIGSVDGFTSLATGFVSAQANNDPSFTSVGLPVIDAPTTAILRSAVKDRRTSKSVVAHVKVFGTSLAGMSVESGEFHFPITVCNGCLVSFDGFDPATVTKDRPLNCDKPLETAGETKGPCWLGQDLPVSCRACQHLRSPDVCDPNVP